MTDVTPDQRFENDLTTSFDRLLSWLIPIVVVAGLVYGLALLITGEWVIGILGALTLLTVPIAWYAKRLLRVGRLWTSLAIFIISIVIILSSALLLVRGLDTAILAGFSIPILVTALLRNVRFSFGIALFAVIMYGCATLLAGYLPWRQVVLAPPTGPSLTLAILMSIFGILGLLSWQIVSMLRRALTLANEHIVALNQATNEQQRIYAVLDAENKEQQRLLTVIAELETPIIPLPQDTLLVPLVGNFDSRRAIAARTRILHTTAERRARLVILDIMGIVAIDGTVAHELHLTAQGVRLLGSEVVFSGIKAEAAQVLVNLGIDLRTFRSISSLEAGIGALMNRDTSVN